MNGQGGQTRALPSSSLGGKPTREAAGQQRLVAGLTGEAKELLMPLS